MVLVVIQLGDNVEIELHNNNLVFSLDSFKCNAGDGFVFSFVL